VATERELKLPVADPDGVRKQLEAVGALWAGADDEVNLILDTTNGALLGAGCGLRVRRVRAGATAPEIGAHDARAILTFKGPREPGAYKEREELETDVSDADTLLEVLGRLGYRPVLGYEKRRARWKLGECEVALDEVPVMGWWVEIEGPDAGAIEAVRAQLRLEEVSAEPRTYVQMAAERGTEGADGVRWLRFS
jgi:adenylate cyclase class 2